MTQGILPAHIWLCLLRKAWMHPSLHQFRRVWSFSHHLLLLALLCILQLNRVSLFEACLFALSSTGKCIPWTQGTSLLTVLLSPEGHQSFFSNYGNKKMLLHEIVSKFWINHKIYFKNKFKCIGRYGATCMSSQPSEGWSRRKAVTVKPLWAAQWLLLGYWVRLCLKKKKKQINISYP